MGEESEADWYAGVRVKMTPNIQLHRSVTRRLRRLPPPGELRFPASYVNLLNPDTLSVPLSVHRMLPGTRNSGRLCSGIDPRRAPERER